MKIGITCALLCAVVWGIWYVPGDLVWSLEPFVSMMNDIEGTHSKDAAFIVMALLITALNATFIVLTLSVWNIGVRKFKEIKRTIRQTKLTTKYFFFAAACGGPIAITGTFLATGFVGAGFAACASLVYPIIGTVLSMTWLKQKMTRRIFLGILIVMLGGLSIYAGGLIEDITSGNARPLGYIGGLMAVIGWGIEGAVAAKGLDVSDSDVALTIRFIMEVAIWWLFIIPILILLGFPVLKYTLMIFDPITLLVLTVLGFTFGFSYVTWYRAFPLLGVGMGQSLGSLYGLFAVVFLFLFVGQGQSWTLLLGAALCITGTFVMFTEKTSRIESLRELDSKEESL